VVPIFANTVRPEASVTRQRAAAVYPPDTEAVAITGSPIKAARRLAVSPGKRVTAP
jgi:hypothetical protein